MNFQIAIPSYQRANKLKNQTLAYLKTQDIDFSKVTIFLKNQEEYDTYAQEISGVKMVICNNKSLVEKRTFINKYYPVGERVVSFDDDIKDICFLVDKQQKLIPFIERMFELTIQEQASLWGIYPTYTTNLFYNQDRVTIGFQFIQTTFCGFINKQLEFDPYYIESEDEWLSLYLYKTEGKTLRYEGASAKTQRFAAGGLQEMRRTHDLIPIKQKLEADFPELCKYKIKKNGRPDIVFNRIKRKVILNPITPHISESNPL